MSAAVEQGMAVAVRCVPGVARSDGRSTAPRLKRKADPVLVPASSNSKETKEIAKAVFLSAGCSFASGPSIAFLGTSAAFRLQAFVPTCDERGSRSALEEREG
jgi:hypothetical protein